MQKPPRPPNQSRPVYYLDEAVDITADAPDHMMTVPRTSSTLMSGPFGRSVPTYYQNQNTVRATTKGLEQEYQVKASQLPQSIEAELAATRLQGPTNPLPPSQSIVRELGVLNKLTQQKTTEFHSKTATANAFYGGDPFNRHINEFMKKATTMEKWPGPNGIAMQALNQSFRAAHDARLLSQTIQSLNQRTVSLQQALSVMQAAERARLAAEQKARRDAAEEARKKEVAEARELARLAALEDARRLAAEQARVAAEVAARYIAAEQARLEAVAEVQRQVEQLRLEQEEELAQENSRQQAHFEAQAEAQRQSEVARLKAQWQAETEARWERPTFANAGSMAVFGPTFTGTLGTVGVNPATSLALRTALRAAVSAAVAALATAATPVLVGFAALLVPSRLGNGDLFSISVPLSELAPDSTADLYELAAIGGEIDLPVRLGSRTIGNRVEIVIVATDGVTVPASVPVRLAHFDARKNVYVSGSTVSNGPVITWTPLVEPQDPSTEFPLIDTDLPIYEGATVTPDTGRIDPFPELDRYGFAGFVTVFPIDSGIPPTFTMFRDRRDDPGIASGYGKPVSGVWLGITSPDDGAAVPNQIADKLRGREFSNFRAFREALWRAVAGDPELAKQFTANNVEEMKNGRAPFTRKRDRLGGQVKFELHHVKHVSKNGEIFDIDNIRVTTPKRHSEIHKGDK